MPSKRQFEEAAAQRGKVYEEEVLYAYAWKKILKSAQGNVDMAQFVTSLANQNLGIHLYEHVCAAVCDTASDAPLAVLQTGRHSVNVSRFSLSTGPVRDTEQMQVKFEAIFETRPIDSVEDALSARMLEASICIVLCQVSPGSDDAHQKGL